MGVRIRSKKTKTLIIVFATLTIIAAGAGGYIVYTLSQEDKTVGKDESGAGGCGTSCPEGFTGDASACYCGHQQVEGACCKSNPCPDGQEYCDGGTCPDGHVYHEGCSSQSCGDRATSACEGHQGEPGPCAGEGSCNVGECCTGITHNYSDSRCGTSSYSKCNGTPSCSDSDCTPVGWHTEVCRGKLSEGCYCRGCGKGSDRNDITEFLNGGHCNVSCGALPFMLENTGEGKLYTQEQYAQVEATCYIVWKSGKIDPKQVVDPQYAPCIKAQMDAFGDGNSYICHTLWEGGKSWDECQKQPEQPRCLSLSTQVGARPQDNSHRLGVVDGIVHVISDTEPFSVRAVGQDPDGNPKQISICYAVRGHSDAFYQNGDSGATPVFKCIDNTNPTSRTGDPEFQAEAVFENLTFASMRAELLTLQGNIDAGITATDINEQGIIVITNIYDNTESKFCSTSPGYNSGTGVYWPDLTACDGDACSLDVLLTPTPNPACINLTAEPPSIFRGSTSSQISFTVTASGGDINTPVESYHWYADTNCDGDFTDSDDLNGDVVPSTSTTNTRSILFTPYSEATTSSSCSVEVRVKFLGIAELVTAEACATEITLDEPGVVIIDKTGPVCVERVAPNNIAHFIITASVPSTSEHTTEVVTKVTDILPPGFRYQADTTRISIDGGTPTALEPTTTLSGDVQTLVWEPATGWTISKAANSFTLTFDSIATASAITGDNKNQVTIEIEDGDSIPDEYIFDVAQSCAPIVATNNHTITFAVVAISLLLGTALYGSNIGISIPKVKFRLISKDTSDLIRLRIVEPNTAFEKTVEKKLNNATKKSKK